MQSLLLALFISGVSAATLHDLSDRVAIPSGERTPINLAQMNAVLNAESAALPDLQGVPGATVFNPYMQQSAELEEQIEDSINGYFESEAGKKLMASNAAMAGRIAAAKNEWQASMPKPKDTMPAHFETDQDRKIWEAEQGHRRFQGDGAFGDLQNALDGLQKINDRAQGRIVKKFAFLEKKAEVTKPEDKSDKEAEAMSESIVEPKSAQKAEDKSVESAGGWDITFYVLLTCCVFVFGWWAYKVGLHERVATAASEFAFQCKKTLSGVLKGGDSHTKMQDDKSESSYDASEGSEGSASSKGALNSHLQGVIDRVKTNLGDEQKK
jgi:hypothetical protein